MPATPAVRRELVVVPVTGGPARAASRRPATDDRGAVAILVAAMLVVFLGLAALVVDLGFARDETRVAQNAADAAALAGRDLHGDPDERVQQHRRRRRRRPRATSPPTGGTRRARVSPSTSGTQTVTVTLPARQEPTFFAGAVDQQRAVGDEVSRGDVERRRQLVAVCAS